jgi:hypothetical protein
MERQLNPLAVGRSKGRPAAHDISYSRTAPRSRPGRKEHSLTVADLPHFPCWTHFSRRARLPVNERSQCLNRIKILCSEIRVSYLNCKPLLYKCNEVQHANRVNDTSLEEGIVVPQVSVLPGEKVLNYKLL